jgi:broad specificity phosphatase PhoE
VNAQPASLEVHLVRHFVTDGVPATWLDRDGLRAWFASEGERGVVAGAEPSAALVAAVAASRRLVVSPLARARATAEVVLARLAPTDRPEVIVVDDLVEIPLPVLPVPGLRLPLDAWDAAARIAWLAGWSGGVESRREAMARGRRVARWLAHLAPEGPVVAVGHGFTNIVVARELRRLGWQGPRLPDHRNGGLSTYQR